MKVSNILAQFLIEAKMKTYASGGASSSFAVKAILPASHQLEYKQENLKYRDIYFGESHFAGQEVVYYESSCIWSMCYYGGWTNELSDKSEIPILASLLQDALKLVPIEFPYRGPTELKRDLYIYRNQFEGAMNSFHGTETMTKNKKVLYKLDYMGGSIE